MSKLSKTPLYDQHIKLNANIVDFGGWALPVNYGSQIDEHNAVRTDCGMFDVSHMTVSDITGAETLALLSKLLANDINKVTKQAGKALYSCMLNQQGGVIDDLIVYYLNDQHYRLVTNAGTRDKDIVWIQQQAQPYQVTFTERPELALIAVQGPNAIDKSLAVLASAFDNTDFQHTAQSLRRFQGAFCGEQFVGRTGYTGEDGFEFIVTADVANHLWQNLLGANIQPCGLGARDTLRLEAGMSLYGNDLDEQHTPLESGLSWTVKVNDQRDFIGKEALKAPSRYKMIGLILQDRGVLRSHQKVFINQQTVGEITSGTFSPTLGQSIAIARVTKQADIQPEQIVQIAIRNKKLNAKVVKYPFVKSPAQ